MERARAVSLSLHDLFKERRKNHAAIARRLWDMKRDGLHLYLGYSSLAAYAFAEHQVGKSRACELAGIAEACERLPELREAFYGGEIDWTKAREVSKVATPETEADWLARAEVFSADDLRALRKGEPRQVRRGLSFTEEGAAEFDQLLAGIRDELGSLSDGEAVLELLRRGASAQGGEAPVQRVVITECGTCREGTTETREGPVPVSAEAVEHARCAGEVHDLRQEPNTVKRSVPARIQRQVLDRDRRHCLVPTCRAMSSLETHHEDGWQKGHDPDRMLTLCWRHHRARHQGLLRIEGSAPEFEFVLLDGEVLERSGGGSAFSYENSCLASVPVSQERAAVAEEVVRDATLALRSLGVKAREAATQIQAALASGPGGVWTASALVLVALQAS